MNEDMKQAAEKIKQLWLDKFTEVCKQYKISAEAYKDRLEALSAMYVDIVIRQSTCVVPAADPVLYERIRNNYDIAIQALLAQIAEKEAKDMWTTFLWLLDKSKGIIIALIIEAIKHSV